MKKTLHIDGMHCISCEVLLNKEVNNIKWAKIINISHKSGKVTLEIKNYNILFKVKKIIYDCGYTIVWDKNKTPASNIVCDIQWKKKTSWIELLAIFIIWWLLFLLLRKIDIYSYFPSLSNNVTIWVALLMWLVASLSTCLAVTGSVVLWFWEYIDDSKGWISHLRVQWSFHLWRILWFFLLWGILWLLWQVFKISVSVNAILTMIVGIVLLYMGLHMLGLVPSITKFGFYLPKKLTKNIFNVKNPMLAPVIWALTFFLPCGFTQSMQLVAMSSGDFWQGWLVMAMFALWTMPILLWVGLWWSYVKEHKFGIVNKIIWALIVIFGVSSINNGWTLFWWRNISSEENYQETYILPDVEWEQVVKQLSKKYEKITIWHNGWSLEPQKVNLKAGENYKLIILPTSNGVWCMWTMIIPKISNEVNRIIKWQAIVYKLEWLKKGIYPVVCSSMWMYQWELVVK